MSENKSTASDALIVFLVLVYNLAIIAGTTYLIVFYDWSMWWYLFAILIMRDVRMGKDKDE